jgi:hypothetical protein
LLVFSIKPRQFGTLQELSMKPERFLRQSVHGAFVGPGIAILFAILVGLEILLWTYWLATGIFICSVPAYDAYIIPHVIGSLHFPITIVIFLVFEHYRELRQIKEEQKQKSSHEAETEFVHQFRESDKTPLPGPGFLPSWAVPVLVAVSTDAFMLAKTAREFEAAPGEVAVTLELVHCAWSVFDAALALIWSVWIIALTARLRKSMKSKQKL